MQKSTSTADEFCNSLCWRSFRMCTRNQVQCCAFCLVLLSHGGQSPCLGLPLFLAYTDLQFVSSTSSTSDQSLMCSESIALRIAAYFEQADYLKNKGVSTVMACTRLVLKNLIYADGPQNAQEFKIPLIYLKESKKPDSKTSSCPKSLESNDQS